MSTNHSVIQLFSDSVISRFSDSVIRKPRRGFTLVELLVTMGIMGFLGIAATSGYHALVRGMTERGVSAAASAAMRAAKGRAQIDRHRVAVFCYNKLLREPSKDGAENGAAAGVLVAVRRVGRLSGVSGRFLYDEFGDLELCFESMPQDELEKREGVRLFKFNDGITKMEYSRVADASYLDRSIQVYLPREGISTNGYAGAYYDLGGSAHPASWKAGDGYGVAFTELQLQEGYVFGTDIPSSLDEIRISKVIEFDPESTSDKEVEIYSTKPNANGMPSAWQPIGSAKSDESGV